MIHNRQLTVAKLVKSRPDGEEKMAENEDLFRDATRVAVGGEFFTTT